jgi:HK97 family phage prohead protease
MTTTTPTEAPEIRLLEGAELRASDEGAERALTGRLVPYDIWAPIGGRFEESMARGVFNQSITQAARALPLLMNHDHKSIPVGKAVEWDDRPDGLHARWIMADTPEARLAHDMAEGDFMTGLSVGFQPNAKHDVWAMADPPELCRVTRRNARLLEASLVACPTWQEAVITHTRSSVAGSGELFPYRNAWAEWLEEIRNAPYPAIDRPRD